jgi:predicted GIY-YIG superfamily endonuclease
VKKGFSYVYILQSEIDLERYYVGVAQDLRDRLTRHNAGQILHTNKWKPWRIKTYVALSDSRRAVALERYLKSSSGRAFAKKRL